MEAEELAVCMIAKDEEELLAPLLDAVSPYVGEIIVVDTGSADKTAEVAAAYATQVYYYPLTSDFSAARNYCQGLASKPWVLVLDADEWPTQPLLNWLATYKPSPGTRGVEIRRENRIDGELLPNKSAYEWHVRLYRREHKWVGPIHEHVWIPDPGTQVERAPTEALLLHHKTAERQERQNVLYAYMVQDKKIYLNLGSGGKPIEEWVNIDIVALPGINLQCNIEKGLPCEDLSVDMIWADQLLEHMGLHTASDVVGDWCRVLKVGGTVTIGTPDLRAVCRAFIKDQLTYLETVQLLYGGQAMRSDYHHSLFDRFWLEGQLGWWGCSDIRWLPSVWWNICVQATKVKHVPIDLCN